MARRPRRAGSGKPLVSTPEQRHTVVLRFARLRHGKPVYCTAAEDDPANHSEGKVIYPDRAAGEAAAAALWLLEQRGPVMYVYECSRSKHGHVHLTRKPQASGAAPDREVAG